MSEGAPRKKISLKGEAPVKKDEQQPAFDASEFRKKSNAALDDLKQQIYSRKLSPAELSKAWQPVRLAHDRIMAGLATYRGASESEQKDILATLKKDYAELHGDLTENVHESLQATAAAAPREKGEVKPDLPKDFDKKFAAALSGERDEFTEREKDVIANLRAQIATLEGKVKNGDKAARAQNEARIGELEQELRRHEQLSKGELPGSKKGAKEKKPVPAEVIDYTEVKEPMREDEWKSTVETGDATPGELKKKLSSAIDGLQEMSKAERHDALAKKYFEKIGAVEQWEELKKLQKAEHDVTKDFYATNGRLGRWYANSTGIGKEGLHEAKTRSQEAAAKLAQLIEAANNNPELGLSEKDKLRGRVHLINEGILRGEQMELSGRVEGLDERGRGVFGRVADAAGSANKWLEGKLGKGGARAARIVGFAALGSIPAASLGALGVTGFLGYTGYKAVRSLLGTSVGTTLGAIAGKGYELTGGKKAAKSLRSEKRSGLTSAADIRRLAAAQKKGSRQAIESKRAKIEIVTALLGGAGTSVEIGHLMSQMDNLAAAHNALGTLAEHGNHGTHLGGGNGVTGAPGLEHAGKVPEGIHIAHSENLTVSIDKHGEGAFQLWKDMKQRLLDQGYSLDDKNLPPTIKHILESSQRELANDYKFHFEKNFGDASGSGVMHAGDTLSINEHGDITFTPKGGEMVTLADGNTGKPEGVFGGDYRPDHVPETASHGSAIDHSTDNDADKYNGTSASYPDSSPDSYPADIPPPPPGMPPPFYDYDQPPSSVSPSSVPPVSGPEYVPSGQTPPLMNMDGTPAGVEPRLVGMDEAMGNTHVNATSALEAVPNAHGVLVDAATRHVYESAQGEYMYGGLDDADADAMKYAIENKVTVFVNHSYNDPISGRIHQVTEFRGADAVGGKLEPIEHAPEDPTTARYDIGPDNFTKQIK